MDKNLRLALLDALHGDDDDLERDLRRATPEEALERLDALDTDGELDNGLVLGPELAWRGWERLFRSVHGDARGEDTLIRSLAGVEEHPELEIVDLPLSRLDALEPLGTLEALVRLRVAVSPACDLAPLIELGALDRVALLGATAPEQARVLEELAERGVAVDDVAPDWAALAAPFADRNLKLAAIATLVDGGALLLPPLVTLAEYELDLGNLARVLASLPSTDERLASLSVIAWCPGEHKLQGKLYRQWDGEDDVFTIRDLTGIEALPGLTRLRIDPLGTIPEVQLVQYRKRGIEIVSYHASMA